MGVARSISLHDCAAKTPIFSIVQWKETWRAKNKQKSDRVLLSLKVQSYETAIKSSRFSIGFRGISRLSSAFIFLRWFKLAHICIQ